MPPFITHFCVENLHQTPNTLDISESIQDNGPTTEHLLQHFIIDYFPLTALAITVLLITYPVILVR